MRVPPGLTEALLIVTAGLLAQACGSASTGAEQTENPITCERAVDCGEGQDCISGACEMVSASCLDGEQNGDETDVDCGPGCRPCSEGQTCLDPDNCLSLFCDEQQGSVCRDCTTSDDCAAVGDSICQGGVCIPRPPSAVACDEPDECESGFCVDDACCDTACDGPCQTCISGTCEQVAGCPFAVGETCAADDECTSGRCDKTCKDQLPDEDVGRCNEPSDCLSGFCYESYTGSQYNACLPSNGASCSVASDVGGAGCDAALGNHGQGAGACEINGECEAVCNAGTWLPLFHDCYGICHPELQPAPHYGERDGECLPSCGVLQGQCRTTAIDCPIGTTPSQGSYDCNFCCLTPS